MNKENTTTVKLTGNSATYFNNCSTFFETAKQSGLLNKDSTLTLYYSSDETETAHKLERDLKAKKIALSLVKKDNINSLDYHMFFELTVSKETVAKLIIVTGFINKLGSQSQNLANWSTLFLNGEYRI